ncbi:hypothetical protein ACMX2H_18505 [Arthrobacter sulfonylureivorans]|uniref:hypothetical protein n=1 Tax=Arthrobacter sulfonylureivorans TaxID=2486855 RepID=UPI0039E220C8
MAVEQFEAHFTVVGGQYASYDEACAVRGAQHVWAAESDGPDCFCEGRPTWEDLAEQHGDDDAIYEAWKRAMAEFAHNGCEYASPTYHVMDCGSMRDARHWVVTEEAWAEEHKAVIYISRVS